MEIKMISDKGNAKANFRMKIITPVSIVRLLGQVKSKRNHFIRNKASTLLLKITTVAKSQELP
jgi:hypothetical protein